MDPHSILVGKIYRNPAGELCRVTSLQNGQISYEVVVGPRSPGTISHSAPRRGPLATFAADMEAEAE
jgi:hypothetical protein